MLMKWDVFFTRKRAVAVALAILFAFGCLAFGGEKETASWERQARRVTITRDDWGIPHIHGKTDADAIFGMIYAQAEDDFHRIEMNYLNALGRVAEAEGESEIFRDLRMRLFLGPRSWEALYQDCPGWLKKLMVAWADGLNFYLARHPEVVPKVIRRFEPWMPLAFSEGSIGWDLEKVSLTRLEAFYGGRRLQEQSGEPRTSGEGEPGGSNGMALGPSRTRSGKAMLLINPHTSFFFREELQVQSEEGLNAYGAVTWGQFFVYQGFNEHAGWMHTSSGVDAVDEYAETVLRRPDGWFYRYGAEDRPLAVRRIRIDFRDGAEMKSREFTVYASHHGPIVREEKGKWIAVRLMNDPRNALLQSYLRTKADGYTAFRQTMEYHTNSSNNTVYADDRGNIAYFHANYVPRRDAKFDWSQPVDGSDPATEWQGIHTVEESPNRRNPPCGWIQNTNNWPYSVSGADSPRQKDYPPYFDRAGENARGLHAIEVLEKQSGFTLESLAAAAYDPHLTAFDELLPALLEAFRQMPDADPLKLRVAAPIRALEEWDRRWAVSSVPTSLAVYWGQEISSLGRRPSSAAGAASLFGTIVAGTTAREKLQALAAACDRLAADFGTWRTPWGEINRFQRLTGDIVQRFRDDAFSIPVGFTSSRWGSLASFAARTYPGTRKMYGTSGNSFVAVVEFSNPLRARAITAGGLSSRPDSKHFNDQAERYARGDLRTVYFYPADLQGHIGRQYHPGQ